MLDQLDNNFLISQYAREHIYQTIRCIVERGRCDRYITISQRPTVGDPSLQRV